MQFKSFLILSLLISVITAPVLDAVACDDCSDIIPLREMQQRVVDGVNRSDGKLLLSDSDHPAQQENETTQDLCPVCANTAVAMVSVWCGAPCMISHTNPLPKLIAFSDPSFSINKPPQN